MRLPIAPNNLCMTATSASQTIRYFGVRSPSLAPKSIKLTSVLAPLNRQLPNVSIVRLMRCLSSHFGGHRSVESDSHKTSEFSARKSCVKKRMRIRDEPSGGSHQSVVFRKSEETVRFPERRQPGQARKLPECCCATPSYTGGSSYMPRPGASNAHRTELHNNSRFGSQILAFYGGRRLAS